MRESRTRQTLRARRVNGGVLRYDRVEHPPLGPPPRVGSATSVPRLCEAGFDASRLTRLLTAYLAARAGIVHPHPCPCLV